MPDSDVKISEIESYDAGIENKHAKYWNDEYTRLYQYGPMQVLGSSLNLAPQGPSLDLACGSGWHTDKLEGVSTDSPVIGIDISTEQLKSAKDNVSIASFCQGDAEQLPFRTNSLSCVLVVAGLHHFPNLGEALDEIARVLEPEGVLVFAEAAKYNPLAYFYREILARDAHTEGEEPLNPRETKKLLSERFSDAEITGHFLVSPAIPFMTNLLNIRGSERLIQWVYDIEKRLLRSYGIMLSANITGIAKSPIA